MKSSSKHQQRGITFFGLLILGIIGAMVVVVFAQIVPTYSEYLSVEKAVNNAAKEDTVANVKRAFERQATIDQINSIGPNDLEISKNGDKVVVKFAYEREIHLAGPAYLVMKYEGQSK